MEGAKSGSREVHKILQLFVRHGGKLDQVAATELERSAGR